jgi:hypothetical protein
VGWFLFGVFVDAVGGSVVPLLDHHERAGCTAKGVAILTSLEVVTLFIKRNLPDKVMHMFVLHIGLDQRRLLLALFDEMINLLEREHLGAILTVHTE